ncbi:MAG: hypothetical protein ABIJ97_06655, partial [Bacteroidota bacterium]
TPVYGGIWEENPDTSTVIDKWVRTNIHEAVIYGVESTVRYNFMNRFIIEGGYNYTYNENTSTGSQLPYFPGESIFSKLIYNCQFSDEFTGSVFISFLTSKNRSAWNWKPASDASYDDESGLITELGDYEMINAGVNFSYYNIRFFVKAENILGQDIEYLDDAYTQIEGEPIYKAGVTIRF